MSLSEPFRKHRWRSGVTEHGLIHSLARLSGVLSEIGFPMVANDGRAALTTAARFSPLVAGRRSGGLRKVFFAFRAVEQAR